MGNIARRSTKVLTHTIDSKADINHVDFVGHDMVGESTLEVHYAVVGQGAGN